MFLKSYRCDSGRRLGCAIRPIIGHAQPPSQKLFPRNGANIELCGPIRIEKIPTGGGEKLFCRSGYSRFLERLSAFRIFAKNSMSPNVASAHV